MKSFDLMHILGKQIHLLLQLQRILLQHLSGFDQLTQRPQQRHIVHLSLVADLSASLELSQSVVLGGD